MKDWEKRLSEEYEDFRNKLLKSKPEDIFDKYIEIMVYDRVYSYLIATSDDLYEDIKLKEVLDYFLENVEIEKFCLTDEDDVIKLLDLTSEEYKRRHLYEKYEREYEDFVSSVLEQDKKEIFYMYERIRFYEILFSWIENTDYETVLKLTKEKTIFQMYSKFEEGKFTANLNTNSDVKNFLIFSIH